MSKSVIVIGAGIAGLAASIRLAKKGHIVTVFEANHSPGGKLSETTLGAYRFDTCPTFLHLPEELNELYQLCGMSMKDHLPIEKLESSGKYFYPDGLQLTAYSEGRQFLNEISSKTNESEENIQRTLEHLTDHYHQYSSRFLNRPLPLKPLQRKISRIKYKIQQPPLRKSIHESNKSHIKNSKVVELFNQMASVSGSDPYVTPAAYNIYPHIQLNKGTYFPKQGMESIPKKLHELADKVGVKFKFDTPVKKIVVFEGQAKGVNTQMGFHKADRVVSNMDIVPTYTQLLKEYTHLVKNYDQNRSGSVLIFHWGIKKMIEGLTIQNIFLSRNPEAELRAIFEKHSIYEDPTINLKISSLKKPENAPEGCMNWSIIIHAPSNIGQDWEPIITQTRKNILTKLSRILNQDIGSLIEVEEIQDPRDIESKTGAWQGSVYGNTLHQKNAPYMRHPNQSRKIKHLYFCGSSVHPGGGIPMCLQSAKIMTELFK